MPNEVRIHFEVKDGPVGTESLWAERVKPGQYRLRNIPFFVYEVAMEDVVGAEERDGRIHFTRLIRTSGHSTIRILFSAKPYAKAVLDPLLAIGCRLEKSFHDNHYAVDIPPTVGLAAAEAVLAEPARAQLLSYEVSAERAGPGPWSN